MKSYPLKVHENVGLMAYQMVLPSKSVYVGLTMTLGMTKVTEIGQEVLNTLAAYSEGRNLTMFQLADPGTRPEERLLSFGTLTANHTVGRPFDVHSTRSQQ